MDDGATKETASTGDTDTQRAGPSQSKEGAAEAEKEVPAEDEQLIERTPIVWTGRPKDPPAASASATEAATDDAAPPRPLQRLKPNTGFLLNLVADAERGNKRKCAEEATQVSLNVLGQAASAGVKPQLARIGPDGPNAAVRRAVLSVAQQQRLAVCSALLREVAASFGFAVHVAPDIGDEDADEVQGTAEAAASGEGAVDGSSTPNGVSEAEKERPGIQALQPLHVRLNLASRRPSPIPDKAAPAPAEDADTAQRPPKPRAPGLNMAASRLAGAALGAIGVAMPETAPSKPSPSQALQKLSAKNEGRSGLFGLGGLANEEAAAASAEEDDDEELDELDDDMDADELINEVLEEAASARHSSDGLQRSNGRAEPESGPGRGTALSSQALRQLRATGISSQNGHGTPAAAARLGRTLPKPSGAVLGSGRLRMDAAEPEDSEEQQPSGSGDDAPPGKRPRTGPGVPSQAGGLNRQRGETPPSAKPAGAAAADRQPRKPAAAAGQPTVDMARLLSRASAAASSQKLQPAPGANGKAAGKASGRVRNEAVSSPNDASSDEAAPARSAEGAAQNGIMARLGRPVRGRRDAAQGEEEADRGNGGRWQPRSVGVEQRESEEDEEADSEGEDQNARGSKNAAKGSRLLFGAAMAGLQSTRTR